MRILLVDDDKNLLAEEEAYFTESANYEVVGTASDGAEAVEKYNELEPDAMVLDMLMPVRDGLSVLEEIDKNGCKIVAVSGIGGESYAQSAINAGADYYLIKPFGLKELEKRIDSIKCDKPSRYEYGRGIRKGSLEQRITDIFMTVGIPAHIKGYQFLREAIKMAIDSPEIINSITKRLYPEVAEKFETSPSKVERAIRHAIEVAWNKGKIENINSIFGIKVYSSTEKPTNGEFIALVADKMLLENM